ncbi:hypothetical protein [Pseudohaliea sp.]|uniref:hypothetical protein n=1 Tax=Pseudohaliea sp. TaxID=2740289 RepID=UPI0032EB7D6C
MNKAPETVNTASERQDTGEDSLARCDAARNDLDALWQAAEPAPPVLLDLEEALERLPLEQRFVALCQLARASSVFQRLAAYRWLAGLHLLDLRYEQRAKRVIAGGLKLEEGLARVRVRELLRRC